MIGVELRGRVAGLMGRAHSDLAELVAIRSVADPRQFPPEECARAAEWVLDSFAELGFADLELAETADGSRRWSVPGPRPTPAPRPCCSTPTTTSSHRWTTAPGAPRRSS